MPPPISCSAPSRAAAGLTASGCREHDQTVGALGGKLFLESSTLTPILKKLESIGYIRGRRDPADERQVRVSLTPAGRRLLETDPAASLVEATGHGEDFPAVQKTVMRLRDNLLRTTQAEPVAGE